MEETPPETMGVLFDPLRRAGSGQLKSAIRAIADDLENWEIAAGLRQRSRIRMDREKFRLALEALVCNLLVVRMLGGNRPLAVPRSSGAMWGKGRYAHPVYGQNFLDVLTALTHPEVAFVEVVTRGFRLPSGASKLTTIQANNRFISLLPAMALDWDMFAREQPPEILVLKGRKRKGERAEEIDYPDTKTTRARRNLVATINERLATAPIFLAATPFQLALDDYAQPIDPTRRSLRRIFNNGKWTEGGRLFDGFWESMKREDRVRYLRIGTDTCPTGEPVANVDFGQLFPRLAYIRADHPAPEGDLYDVLGDGSCRDGFKTLVNAMLFIKGRLIRWPEDTRRHFPPTAKLAELVAAIEAKHEPIAGLFGTGIGYTLMFTESEILIRVLGELHGLGITALPLHDSVLVAKSKAEQAREVLEQSFPRYLLQGTRATVSTA